MRLKKRTHRKTPKRNNTVRPDRNYAESSDLIGHRQRAADIVLNVMSVYAAQGSSLCLAALAGARRFEEWQHYPKEDALDRVHRTGFYYHAHAKAERAPREHGHFHVFARSSAGFHHLAGISLNETGWPMRLFVTNQWVTGEDWLNTDHILPLLQNFSCSVHGRLAPVARWITAMIYLYQEDVLRLHREKDAWLDQQQGTGKTLERTTLSCQDAFSDKAHHVLAQVAIDLAQDLKKIL
jgi:hypothetical protein